MKNLCKRLLAMILVAGMLVSILPTTVLAADTDNTEKTEKVEVSDDYINVTVSTENGGFHIATATGNQLEKSDDNKNLLYPSADYDTSYTSIRVTRTDGTVEDYIFGRKYGFLGIDSSDVVVSKAGNSVVATWSVKDITVTQTLGILDETASQHGMVSIGYEVTTNSDDVADVKIRIMLDTALGEQDYGYYQVPNVLNEYESIASEKILDNSNGDAYNATFFAIDDPLSPKVNAYTVDVALNGEMVEPYQVAFGHWNSLASSVFDFSANEAINFTNQYNVYGSADSAYALYYDLGAIAAGEKANMSTYYGVYSNSTVSEDESVSINFTALPASMTLNEDETAYISQLENGNDGDIRLQLLVENIKSDTLGEVTLVVKAMNNVTPYIDWNFNKLYEQDSDYTEVRTDVLSGEELAFDIYFNVTPLSASEYRRFEVLCYAAGEGDDLTEANLLGSREFYLFCPGELGEVVVFNSLSPQVIHYEGTRRLYLSGQNMSLMQDTSAYTTYLHPVAGGEDVIIPSKNVFVDTTNNSMYLMIDTEMVPGGYQVIFDWNEDGKEDTTATALQFQVSNKPQYVAPTYGIVTIEKGDDFTEQDPTYQIGVYETEAAYANAVTDPDSVYLEFRGDFGARYDEKGNIVEVKAASQKDIYDNIINTINISNCIDVEDGFVSINVENVGTDSQCINVDIEGKVYTTSSRVTIWDGVCAITSFENGELNVLNQYKHDGTEKTDVENSTANTNAITLLWPGAASAAQTLAGVIFEFRYCEFGMIQKENGSSEKERVISFGAQMSPNFLVPRNFDWGNAETSPLELAQMKLAKSNYNAHQLRAMEQSYRYDQACWEDSQAGTLNIYVDNILFGSRGFIGFVASVEIGIPSYTDGMPEIVGTLDMHILPALDYWEVGLEGEADFVALKVEAAIALKQAYGGVPGVDKFYFYVEGDTPGINVDGYGVFWIQGLGGGIDNVYDTIYSVSKVPPLTIMLSGKFALFSLMEARADMTISPREFSVALSNLGIKDITLIEQASLQVRWYPDLYLRTAMSLNVLDIIQGDGYIIVEKNSETDSYFWEGYARAMIYTPDLPFVGQVKIGGASIGLNTNKMWSALNVLGFDMGLTYYWGGDVDFGFGKYDAPESTYPLALATVAVGQDEETGETLYMAVGTNAIRLNGDSSSEPSITSSVDRMSHTIDLAGYKASRDIVLTMTFEAESAEEAERIAKGDTEGNEGIKLVATDDETVTYDLNWLDASKDVTTQTDANALVSYNEETGLATLTISFTEQEDYAHDWLLTIATGVDISLYEMSKMADLDAVEYVYDEASNEITLDWSGYQLEDFENLSVYAVDADGNTALLYETDDYSVIAGGMANATEGSATFEVPSSLASGTYSLQVVVNSETNNICDIVEETATFTYVNENQPSEPEIESIALGGDYTINAVVNTEDTIGDGYVVTVYEKNADGEWVTTSLGAQYIEAEEDGSFPSTITVGGQYDADTEDGTNIIGLEAGKTYRIGVIVYNQDENGNELFSKEVYSDEIEMKAPVKPNVTVSAVGATTLTDTTGAAEAIDYVTTKEVKFEIASDVAVSGTWSLDAGAETGDFAANTTTTLTVGGSSDTETALTEGEHTLSLTGTNANGDAFAVDYRFYVKTTAPRLQLSSPFAGSFFGETVNVTGLGDPGTTVYVLVDGVAAGSAVVDDNSQFTVTVAMDMTKYSQIISVYAVDALGICSYQHDIELINEMVSAEDVSLAIFVDGKDYTNKTIPAGTTGTVELRVTAKGKSLSVPENSLLGNQAEWDLYVVDGNATLTDMQLVTDSDANGMLRVEFEGYDVATVLGGNRDGNIQQTIELPTTGEGYTITPLTDTTVVFGGSFLFTIEIEEGYVATEDFVVKANGTVIEPSENGVYTVANIFENITITVEGVEKEVVIPEEYTVTLPTGQEGYTVIAITDTTVTEGESFQFKIELAEGYVAGKNYVVKVNGTAIEAGKDGIYTIMDVTEDISITVEGVEEEIILAKGDAPATGGICLMIGVLMLLVVIRKRRAC